MSKIIHVEGNVQPTWELTQEAAQKAISDVLGFKVEVGDDAYVWLEDNPDVVLGTLGWTEQAVGELGHDGLSKWHFEYEWEPS
jgi:hypothetical protein